MKTLRVCKMNDLPPELERNDNYLYLAYDKLIMFSGQNTLYENFCIVSSMPQEPVTGLIYIYDTDGSVHIWENYTDNKVATIESASMVQYIQKAGTMFYVNVNKRYIDSQRRVLTLPYNDGSYELSVELDKEQMFTNDTILKFNPDTEKFEIYGPHEESFIDWSREFHGVNTDTVIMTTDGPRICASVRVSQRIHNAIKAASDGLYVNLDDKLDRATFEEFEIQYMNFRTMALEILERVATELEYLEDIVSEETVTAEIMEILRERYPTIDQALADYNAIIDQMNNLESTIITYANMKFNQTREEVLQEVTRYGLWEDLDVVNSTYSSEVDYYEVARQYLSGNTRSTRSLSNDQINLLLQAAVLGYLSEENNDNNQEDR